MTETTYAVALDDSRAPSYLRTSFLRDEDGDVVMDETGRPVELLDEMFGASDPDGECGELVLGGDPVWAAMIADIVGGTLLAQERPGCLGCDTTARTHIACVCDLGAGIPGEPVDREPIAAMGGLIVPGTVVSS